MSGAQVLPVTPKNEEAFSGLMPRPLGRNEIALGACLGDAPCGLVMLGANKKRIRLDWLYVLPEYRRSGAGTALLAALDRFQKEVDCDLVLPQEEELYRFLLYCGFTERAEELLLYEAPAAALGGVRILPGQMDRKLLAKARPFREMTANELAAFVRSFPDRFPGWLDPAAYGGLSALDRDLSFFHGPIGKEDAFLFTVLPQPEVVMIAGLYASGRAKLSLAPMLQKALEGIASSCPDRTFLAAAATEDSVRLIEKLRRDTEAPVRIRRQVPLRRKVPFSRHAL